MPGVLAPSSKATQNDPDNFALIFRPTTVTVAVTASNGDVGKGVSLQECW